MQPLQSAAEDDSMTERSNGMAVAMSGTDVVLTGGWSLDRLWCLSLPQVQWSEFPCSGEVPAPRLYHAVAADSNSLFVSGGELLAVNERGLPSPDLSIYRLERETNCWSVLRTTGAPPLFRSHHTMTLVGGHLVVYGGKAFTPVRDGQHGTLSNSAIRELIRRGFYDVFVLSLGSLSWRRVPHNIPTAPHLWGHAAAPYGSNCVLFHGGFDVTPVPGGRDVDAPSASLQVEIFAFDIDTMNWAQCTDVEKQEALDNAVKVPSAPRPRPRALHAALMRGDELFVIGGLSFSRGGIPETVTDCWCWDATRNLWRQVDFCLKTWKTLKPISVMYYDQLVVTNKLSEVFFFDLRSKGGWQRISCAVNARHWVQHSPLAGGKAGDRQVETASEIDYRKHQGTLPQSSSSFMLKKVDEYRREKSGYVAPDEPPTEAELLQLEVDQLRAQVALKTAAEEQQIIAAGGGRKPPEREEDVNDSTHASSSARDDRRRSMMRALGDKKSFVDTLSLDNKSPSRLSAVRSPKRTPGSSSRVAFDLPSPSLRPAVLDLISGPVSPTNVQRPTAKGRHMMSSPTQRFNEEDAMYSPNRVISPRRQSTSGAVKFDGSRSSTGVESSSDVYGSVASSMDAYQKMQQQHKTISARRKERIARLQKRLSEATSSAVEDLKITRRSGGLIDEEEERHRAPPPPRGSSARTEMRRASTGTRGRAAAAAASRMSLSGDEFDDGLCKCAL